MDSAKMNALLSLMTPEEIEDGLWLVSVFERWGSIDQADADERRRILATQRFQEIDCNRAADG